VASATGEVAEPDHRESWSSPVFRDRRRILATGGRVEVRRSRSHATQPQGATSTLRPGAGHLTAEEDGTAWDACRMSPS
jgi:hypothetical protein